MNNLVFEADIECTYCKGTGIYKGMAERGEAGVVCYGCKGTGMLHVKHEYTKFTSRVIREDIKRVYKTAGGYGIRDTDYMSPEGVTIKFSEGGTSYKDWLEGKKPRPIRDLHCPLQHYEQGTDEGEWLKDHGPCSRLGLGGMISTCAKKNREECWRFVDSLPEKFKD